MGTLETLANPMNPTMIIIVILVIVLLFGGTKIPEMMKGMGQGMKEFKKGMNDDADDELRKDKERREAELLKK